LCLVNDSDFNDAAVTDCDLKLIWTKVLNNNPHKFSLKKAEKAKALFLSGEKIEVKGINKMEFSVAFQSVKIINKSNLKKESLQNRIKK